MLTISGSQAGLGFTRDFEELAVWLATKCDKKTVSRAPEIASRDVVDFGSGVVHALRSASHVER